MGSVEYFGLGGRPLFELAIVLTLGACVLVAARLAFRCIQRRDMVRQDRLGWDDYCIVAAVMIDIAMGCLTVTSIYYGYGNPEATLSLEDKAQALLMFWSTQITYKAVMMFTKLSLLCMYMRIFNTRKWFIYSCYVVGGVVVCYAFATIMATIFQCIPVSRAWYKSHAGHCIDMTAFWYANAVASITTDLTIIALPMYPVYMLQIPKRSKFLLACVFLVGGIVILASILRMTTLKVGSQAADQTAGTLASTCWTTVEANVGIIGACLPILRNAIVSCFPKLLGSRNRSAGGNDSNNRHSIHGSLALRAMRSPARKNYRDLDGEHPHYRHSATAGSDEAILEEGFMNVPMGGISKKTELDIVIHDADSSDGAHSK